MHVRKGNVQEASSKKSQYRQTTLLESLGVRNHLRYEISGSVHKSRHFTYPITK